MFACSYNGASVIAGIEWNALWNVISCSEITLGLFWARAHRCIYKSYIPLLIWGYILKHRTFPFQGLVIPSDVSFSVNVDLNGFD